MNQRSVDGWSRESEDLMTLVERGRRLHSAAVFEAFVRMLGLGKVLGREKPGMLVEDDAANWVAGTRV